jgi:hypothetical protein
MVQTFLGFEVIESRFKHMKSLGVKNLDFKLEDTPECVNNLRRAFFNTTSSIEVCPEIAMVCFWRGDADGDPNSYTVLEDGEEVPYPWCSMSDEQHRLFYEGRKVFAKQRGYV